MDDLEEGSVRAVALLDEDVAVWRGRNGSVRAWRNRCPHRGMRLSFAQVRGDRLSCRYHGRVMALPGFIAMPGILTPWPGDR